MDTEILLRGVNVKEVYGVLPENIYKITDFSEKVEIDSLFFCVDGNNYKGENYIKEAIRRGAKIILGEKYVKCEVCFIEVEDVKTAIGEICGNFYGRPQDSMKIIGVVGTNGKTSTCHIASKIFEYAGEKTAIIGTLGVTCGEDTRYTGLTTLGTIELYETLSELKKKGVERVFTEVSAHAIEQRRTEGIYFDCLVFTNCTEDHLDYFKSFQEYKQTKKSFFANDICRYAVVNADDSVGREIIREGNVQTVTYGITNPSDVFAIDICQSERGISYIINLFDMIYDISCPLIGMHNVYNTLAAATVAAIEGIKLHKISGALKNMKAIKGRAEFVRDINGGRVYLDYAHTPDGLKQTLSAFRQICDGRLICLFGCGGNREKEKRSIMGEIAGVLSDFTVVTTDNPRFEDPYSIISEIESGIRRVSLQYITISDRREAIKYAVSKLKIGDVLVVAGKGAEDFQEIMGVKREFSDRRIIEESAIGSAGEIIE